ncbi:2,3-diketo-5-methylthio-1-phosphopentane phosphatase [Labrys miyagiensis]|uniref:2,3-diketo-5-methylthio-1-phosphopentane phosphatase n=1 Tax=Labrys miyagiensis TaxID=346912 RepID=A0ABQ6CAN1_9HYPH|nr:MtnX-like HAD-IB family phosphatase [Labrys miyagiensis]GLS17447.1 2,3-diketo-5-methylthio-1-phosphopentane phosphatase [Labrys miyagiensis]
MTYRILCDFDGTVTHGDVTDMLLEAFAEPGWRDIEAQWQAGVIGSAACMERQVALLRCDRQALNAMLDTVQIDVGFLGFAARCRQLEIPLAIVSDGLDYAIRRILSRDGIGDLPVIANRLIFLDDERYAMLSPHAVAGCRSAAGTCKCRAADPVEKEEQIVLIGDGRSDFCVAEAADIVFAKDELLAYCRLQGIEHVPFEHFAQLTDFLSMGLDCEIATATAACEPSVVAP